MNRRERRAKARERRGLVEAVNRGGKIPVIGRDERVLALVQPRDVKFYESAPNAKVSGREGEKVIVLRHFSDDSSMVKHRGNPRRYSHDHETSQNPARVWTMRKLAPPDKDGEAFVQRIFRASVLDNLKQAA